MSAETHCDKCSRPLVPCCPICGKEVEVYSRVVGYFRPVSRWNKGKQEEYRDRKEYKNVEETRIRLLRPNE